MALPRTSNPHGFAATFASAARIFLAEALILPTGMVTAVYLTRRLGPADYGLFSLAATLASWLGWLVGAMYGRATVKLVSESRDAVPEKSPAVATMLRAYATTGAAAAIALFFGADALAALFGEGAIAIYLRWMALEVLLLALAMAHKEILVGLGRFRERAICAATRWVARMVFVVALVHYGLSVQGAVLGSVLATALELLLSRIYVRPALFSTGAAVTGVWSMAAPLVGYSICVKLFQRVDLFALKALGGSAADAGYYGAAHNLSIALSLVTLSLAPLLLANLVRLRLAGDRAAARALCSNALRFTVALLPFAAAAAGASDRLVPLLFGERFAATAPLFSLLIFAEIAMVLCAVSSSLIIAADRSRIVLVVSASMLAVAVVGHAGVIPRFGAVGAAAVTTVVAVGGALVYAAVVSSLWSIALPVATFARAVVLAGVAAAATAVDLGPQAWVLAQLVLAGVAIVAGFVVSGELAQEEKAKVLALVRRRVAGAGAL
jgi:O-antigen/teichoic acid export membrane protein